MAEQQGGDQGKDEVQEDEVVEVELRFGDALAHCDHKSCELSPEVIVVEAQLHPDQEGD